MIPVILLRVLTKRFFSMCSPSAMTLLIAVIGAGADYRQLILGKLVTSGMSRARTQGGQIVSD
jgi:hypothetical protein